MAKQVFKETLADFPQLNIPQQTHCGSDVIETFNSLGINTGNVNKQTIDAWFDTDCEATKELLAWLCTNLDKDNVLTAHENEEYEQLLESNSLLNGKQYEVALTQLQNECPGILNYEKNSFEVDCLEDELEMMLNDEIDLEHQLNMNGNLNKKLSKEVNKASEEEISSNIQREKAQEYCLELSYKLDESHKKLQQQIIHYAEHLNEFEHSTRPKFISTVPLQNYDSYYNDIVMYLSLMMKRGQELLPKLDITIKSARKRLLKDTDFNIDVAVDQLEILRQRISKSVSNYLHAQIIEERLQAEVQFLKTINLNEYVSGQTLNESSLFTLEASVLSKEELLKVVCMRIEDIARRISNGFVDRPKINLIESTMQVNQAKLENLTKIDIKITEILAKHLLLYLLQEKEKTDIQSTDKFFRDVYYYITHNLQQCQSRTEAMIAVINDYSLYKDKPIEEKFKLLSVIKALLIKNEEESSNLSAIEVVKNFNNERDLIEHQAFCNDLIEHRQFTREMEHQIEIMQKFLISGPTKQMVVIPHELSDNFNKINQLLEERASVLKSSVQILNDAEKTISKEKWFQMHRHLWMWFLLEPKKVIQAIAQVETAVKRKRNENA